MKTETTRRTILKGGLAMAGLGVIGVPEWALPVLAQGETVVPFTDIPENVRWETPPDRRMLDVRTIEVRSRRRTNSPRRSTTAIRTSIRRPSS